MIVLTPTIVILQCSQVQTPYLPHYHHENCSQLSLMCVARLCSLRSLSL